MSRPDIGELEITKVNEVLKTSTLSFGPMLREFEDRFADYVGANYAVGVSSGTAGLHLAIRAADIKEGDEVITTPFSFVASANCLLYEGARPVFVDIEPNTFNMDPDLIEERITEKTKAILPVHVFGQPCEMDEIIAIAERVSLNVIEDASEALGAQFDGRKVGSFGDLGVYGFYPNKQLTTGEGGMVVTDDPQRAALLRSLRNQGRDDNGGFNHVRLGYNYRIDELSCALGVAQLQRIDDLLTKRAKVAACYTRRLRGTNAIQVLEVAARRTMSWFVYVIRLSEEVNRDRIMAGLAAEGIPSRSYFGPIHLQPYMREALRLLNVIEDASEALGAQFDGRKVGSFGDLGVYGFYPNKQLTTGEGGMVVTDDPQRAALLRSLRNQGRDDNGGFNHVRLGYNYRIDELSCALGVAQLQRIDDLLTKRAKVAACYTRRLRGTNAIQVLEVAARRTMSWFVYVIRLSEEVNRDRIMAGLAAEGIPSRSYFGPIHLQPYMREALSYEPGDFPATEAIARSTFALPFHGNMREEEVEYVCDALLRLVG